MAIRDILIELGASGLFRARWTEQIHDEWIKNLLERRPDLDEKALAKTRELMNGSVRDCLVEGYESLIEALELPDPDDRHVLAAAIKCNADVIVTYNLKDFPEKHLQPYGIEAQHPDIFLWHALDLSKGTVCEAVKRCRARKQNPPLTVEDYLRLLERSELMQFVADLREFGDLL